MLLIFLLLWIIFQARLTVEIAIIGLLVAAAVYWGCVHFMGYSRETDKKILRKCLLGLRYAAVLVWHTLKANVAVSKIVYAREIDIEPQIIFFKTDLQSDAARVTLSSSITLTPGTITVAVNEDRFCVHCLNSQMAEEAEHSSFIPLLKEMEED